MANDLARPANWKGPTAGQLWAAREPISDTQRAAFLATVDRHRGEVRAAWEFSPDEPLTHDEAAAIDRRAVRGALVAHDLLRIHPRRRKRRSRSPAPPTETLTKDAGPAIKHL